MATLKSSKAKGSTFERKIATELSNVSKIRFIRSPSSGAVGTKTGITGLQGDIIRGDLKPIPYIECKKYEDFRLENFFLGIGNEQKWLDQTIRESNKESGWIIIFQKNYGKHIWVCTTLEIQTPTVIFISRPDGLTFSIIPFSKFVQDPIVREKLFYE